MVLKTSQAYKISKIDPKGEDPFFYAVSDDEFTTCVDDILDSYGYTLVCIRGMIIIARRDGDIYRFLIK